MAIFSQIVAVAVGGAVGALARYGIAAGSAGLLLRWRGPEAVFFPWGTLIANVVGAFLMGVLFQLFSQRFADHESLRLLLTTGFLGALTTFSTFALEGVSLWQGGNHTLALGYIILSNLLGLSAVWLGMQVAS